MELKLYPDDPVSNYMTGSILKAQNREAEAVPYYEKAIRFNPKYREALLELGQSQVTLHHPEDALEPLRRAIAIDPDSSEAHYILGTAYRMLGRSTDAVREREIAGRLQARHDASRDERKDTSSGP
jgi:tetratricopeptide (TPR) repeat protein